MTLEAALTAKPSSAAHASGMPRAHLAQRRQPPSSSARNRRHKRYARRLKRHDGDILPPRSLDRANAPTSNARNLN